MLAHLARKRLNGVNFCIVLINHFSVDRAKSDLALKLTKVIQSGLLWMV